MQFLIDQEEFWRSMDTQNPLWKLSVCLNELNVMQIKYFVLSVSLFIVGAETGLSSERSEMRLGTKNAQLVVDLGGGSIKEFKMGADGLNPLQWDSMLAEAGALGSSNSEPRSMGHFLCLDRWGPATEGEQAHGMGWHGEATRVFWKVVQSPQKKDQWIEALLDAELPLAGLSVERSIKLHEKKAIFRVVEAVTNSRPLGRIYNIVQHATIGPPFLDESVVVDSNAMRGFMQNRPMPNPEIPEVEWPHALTRDGKVVDLRYLKGDHEPPLVSFIVNDEYGWMTASNSSRNLLIGYLWKTVDYPWIDMWRNARNGHPYARGLEFGTSGLHKPGPILVEKGKIFDRKLFRFIDADETQRFSYACFLLEIPSSFGGVSQVIYDGQKISIKEKGELSRTLVIEVGPVFE